MKCRNMIGSNRNLPNFPGNILSVAGYGNEKSGGLKVRFSIGAKLIIIISIIVLVSLGSITALVSWLVREDLKISAEENNFEVNRRAASETEQTLEKMRLFSLMFARTADALGSNLGAIQKEAFFFFSQNPQVTALFYTQDGTAPVWANRVFVNEPFFSSRGIDLNLADSYFMNNREKLDNASAGQIILDNASPWFNITQKSTFIAALFFPIQEGRGCVLFSTDNLNESFGMGANPSYLLNADGVIVADADTDRVKMAENLFDKDYVRQIFDSPDSNKQILAYLDTRQTQYKTTVPAFILRLSEIVTHNMNKQKDANGKVRHYLAYTRLGMAGAGSVVITTIEYDKVFEGINATTRRNIYLTAAVLFVSIMFIWFFAKSISVPLKALTAAAQKIESGDFDVRLEHESSDEIGVLTESSGKMCAALNVFGKFTNHAIAVQAMRGEIKPGGLLKQATIFFSDIRDFTKKSENFVKAFGNEASDRIVFWLNEYLTAMVECVEETNGVVDKFIGDAVMAHWGTARTAGNPQTDALNCVKAALLMRTALIALNKNRSNENFGNPPYTSAAA